jgi:hypothetical protein
LASKSSIPILNQCLNIQFISSSLFSHFQLSNIQQFHLFPSPLHHSACLIIPNSLASKQFPTYIFKLNDDYRRKLFNIFQRDTLDDASTLELLTCLYIDPFSNDVINECLNKKIHPFFESRKLFNNKENSLGIFLDRHKVILAP